MASLLKTDDHTSQGELSLGQGLAVGEIALPESLIHEYHLPGH